ncbi:hypothetical protein [Parabacteroides pacaensis]|uniref:hypothetical protein n=1 Tax=Parabacteroides pacaensis TaxID=2086575 RepID=UPI000D114B2A|nr:hypothetical protein [Parabacteroides pacaensis]
MKTVKDILKAALLQGACSNSSGVTNWKSLVWLFFSPQGREFCENNKFPSLEMFQGMKEHVHEYGVFVDAGNIRRENDTNIGLIGNTTAELIYSGVESVHKVILMHGAKAFIKASNYAVIVLVNIGNCDVKIEKDNTVVIL